MINKYELPSAEELRKYQSKRRVFIIEQIKKNANNGYIGLSLRSELFPKTVLEELKELGYEVTENDKFVNIKWGEEENDKL